MSTGELNIWIGDFTDAGETFSGSGTVTILDCNGILESPQGRFRAQEGHWCPLPEGRYRDLPLHYGHLKAELPPGCYLVVANCLSRAARFAHLNYATHIGIAEVIQGESIDLRLSNASIRLCWNWALENLRVLAGRGGDPEAVLVRVKELEDVFFEPNTRLCGNSAV